MPSPAAALQFPQAHPAVIPEPRDTAEFEANLKLMEYPIPPALWAELRAERLLLPDAPTPGDNSADIPLSGELIPLFGRKIPLFGHVAEFAIKCSFFNHLIVECRASNEPKTAVLWYFPRKQGNRGGLKPALRLLWCDETNRERDRPYARFPRRRARRS